MPVTEIDDSLQDFIRAVRAAFEERYPPKETGPDSIREYPYWIRDVFPDHIIVEDGTQLYSVALTVDDGQVMFASRSEWEKVRLSYIQEFTVGEFRGDFPEVPAAAGVDLEALKADDPAPFFVTLPVGKIGEVSDNGLEYDEDLVNGLVAQINAERPTGIMGHLTAEQLSTEYPEPEVYWVGATLKEGTAWAKGYVPPGKARDTLRRLKAVGGKAATSIFGLPGRRVPVGNGNWKAEDFRLQQLDLAPYERAALRLGGGFVVTAEMDYGQEREDDMPTREQIIAELTIADISQALREQIVNEHQVAGQQQARIAELEQQVQQRDTVMETLRTQLGEYQVREFNAQLDGLLGEFIKLESKDEGGKTKVSALTSLFRSRLVAEIGQERDLQKVKATAQKLWDEEFKVVAETIRDALAGPAAIVGGKGPENWREELAGKADELRKERGL